MNNNLKKKNVYWSRCKFTDTPENFLFRDLKETLLVSTNKAVSHHPAPPCSPAGGLSRATYRCSLYTDEWREYCWCSAWKRAGTLAAAAPRSTESWVPNLTFPCPWWESRPCWEKQTKQEPISCLLLYLLLQGTVVMQTSVIDIIVIRQ